MRADNVCVFQFIKQRIAGGSNAQKRWVKDLQRVEFFHGVQRTLETEAIRSLRNAFQIHLNNHCGLSQGFLRYTFSPTFSSRSVTDTFPSVLAMMIVLPEADGPNSLLRSTLIVRMFPSTFMSTFFN